MHNVACLNCALVHSLPEDTRQALASAQGFVERHPQHEIVFDIIRADEYQSGRIPRWAENADVKLAYQATQSLTVTSLNSLASSATAGWQSDEIVNTTNLWLDIIVQVIIDHANTAPANSKGHYIFAGGAMDTGGPYTNPCTGAEGTLTLLDVTANAQALRLAHFLPYTTADEVAESAPFALAQCFGGIIPPEVVLAIINHTGAAIAATGNSVKYRGTYATVI